MRATLILCAALLAGCATQNAAPPGAQVPAERLQQTVIAGQTTRAQLLAEFGPTKNVRFDSGFEAWVYQSPSGSGQFAEFVVLIDPAGIVAKTRTRAPTPAP